MISISALSGSNTKSEYLKGSSFMNLVHTAFTLLCNFDPKIMTCLFFGVENRICWMSPRVSRRSNVLSALIKIKCLISAMDRSFSWQIWRILAGVPTIMSGFTDWSSFLCASRERFAVSGRMLEYLERFLKIVPTLTASGFVLHKTTARGVEVSGIAVAVERNCLFEIASRVDRATTRAAASVSFDSHIKLLLLIAFGRQFFSTSENWCFG